MHNKFNTLQYKFVRKQHKLLQSKPALVYNIAFALFKHFKDKAWRTLQQLLAVWQTATA
ncbi:MAG: hypothetical protein WA123_12705 [Methylotenera sp.]